MRHASKPTAKKAKLYNISATDVPAAKFFYTLSQQTGTNMIVDAKVQGNITFDLKNVTLDNILELLSTVHGYYFKRVGEALYVSPQHLETKIFTIRGLALSRHGSTSINVGGGNESMTGSNSSANVETSFDIQNIWDDIKGTIQAIIGKKYTPPVLQNDFAIRTPEPVHSDLQ